MNSIVFFLRFANRNLKRRKTRSLLLGISIGCLAVLGVLFMGFSDGITHQLIDTAKENIIGENMILDSESDDYFLWPKNLKSFSADKALLDHDLKTIPRDLIMPRYRTRSFAYSQKSQLAVLLMGGDTSLFKKVTIISGNLPKEDYEIIISEKIAGKLHVQIGDPIAVEVTTVDSRRNFDYFTVSGIYKILGLSAIMGGHIAIAGIDSVRTLKNDTPDSVTEITILPDAPMTSVSLTNQNLEIIPASKYGSLLLSIATTCKLSVGFIWVIMIIIIAVFLFDSVLGIIEERKKEFGIMLSLGLGTIDTTSLILIELFILAVYSVIPGTLIGMIIVLFMRKAGLAITSESMRTILGGFEKLYPYLEIRGVVVFLLLMIAGILLIGYLGLLKLTKLKVVEVMK